MTLVRYFYQLIDLQYVKEVEFKHLVKSEDKQKGALVMSLSEMEEISQVHGLK